MKILLTNDDGYYAYGINYLYEFLTTRGHECYITAPKSERSAASSSLSISGEIKIEKINDWTYSIDGTPVDSLKLGLLKCMDSKPDLIISGINLGPNLGTDTLYSGTVGAALEGAVLGYRSIALSTNARFATQGPGDDFDEYLGKAIDIAFNTDIPKYTMLNINIPRCDIQGIKCTSIGMVLYRGDYADVAGKESTYSINGVHDKEYNIGNEVDDRYFFENYMTITPLHYDMTNYKFLKELSKVIMQD